MTLVRDEMDSWLEAALEYVRDQLRRNATVGVNGSEGTQAIEASEPLGGQLARLSDSQPTIWIVPRRTSPRRRGNVIEHDVLVEIQTYMVLPLDPVNVQADAQQRFRQYTSRVWNEALHLRDSGIASEVWEDWDPAGDVEWVRVGFDGRDLHAGVMRFRFVKDIIWMQEGA